ncbi:hypothetical protein [Pseudomonas putida]
MRGRQRGSATLETAFTLAIVVAAGLVCTDLFLLARARADLERSTHMLGNTLASQTALTANGVNKLIDALAGQRGDSYQLYVGKVLRNRTVSWQLRLGQASGLCDSPLDGGTYTGSLPEADDQADSSVALLVVRACQATQPLGLTQLNLDTSALQVDSISRLRSASITLDEELAALAGVQQ